MIGTILRLAINGIPGLRCSEKFGLTEKVSSREDFLGLKPIDIARDIGRVLRNTVWDPRKIFNDALEAFERTEKRGIDILPYDSPSYPPQLREIFDPPFLLYARGRLPEWDAPLLGIVGTRVPSGEGRGAAYETAYRAAGRGIGVVSGLARGIDGEAHRGSLDGGGLTVAVLGNGADSVYPRSHRFLALRIIDEGGLLLTEYGPGAKALQFHFPARNRIISGLSRGVLVVEAPEKSGALITADYALEQGRDLFVHAACLDLLTGRGCRKLAEDGALAVRKLDDILSDWYLPTRTPTNEPPAVTYSKVPAEGLPAHPGILLARCLEEELSGAAVLHGGNYFRRTQNG